jgi:hypothetical protein
MRLVSLVTQSLGGYRVLTYTSKNEFYVIDVAKDVTRKHQARQKSQALSAPGQPRVLLS